MKYILDDISDIEENRKEEERGPINENPYVKDNWLYETIKEYQELMSRMP